jgi:hypothetical protein
MGDWPINFRKTNVIYFQSYVNFSFRKKRVIQVPYNIDSLKYLQSINYSKIPNQSFVGYVPKLGPRRVLKGVASMPFSLFKSNGYFVRKLMIKKLRNVPKIELIIRNKFGAAKAGYTHDMLMNNRKAFLNSIEKSQIVWAPRGDANQSMRLYEAMSAGRIVLVPNSNMNFPFRLCSRHSIFLRQIPWRISWKDASQDHWDKIDSNEWIKLSDEMKSIFAVNLNYQAFIETVLQDFFLKYKQAEIANFCTSTIDCCQNNISEVQM